MWLGTDKNKSYAEITYVGRHVTECGPSVGWGNEHPFGWEELGAAIRFLETQFEALGWYGRLSETTRIIQIKEKFGGIRVYVDLSPEDKPTYVQVLEWLLELMPEVAPHLEADQMPRLRVFESDSYDEVRKWVNKHDGLSLEEYEELARGVQRDKQED